MCGVTGIINITNQVSTQNLVDSTLIVRHRGPDDEGYLLWNGKDNPQVYAGSETSHGSSLAHQLNYIPKGFYNWKVGLGHRRLSILDLSPAGHQPMIHPDTGVTLSFNGEVYNYKELKNELAALGHSFYSQTDTEVILKSWIEWGEKCLNKFNGMFALLILDPREGGKFYAVRDRFGVKPVYWTKTKSYFAFSSEIKQLKILPNYSSNFNTNIIYDYLAYGQLDHTEQTFDNNIFQLKGGQLFKVNLINNNYTIENWYNLPTTKWKGTDKEAIERFKELLTDSVRLRLRADVTVGSCLSGGLDSSAIVCLMEKILSNQANKGIQTITACFEEKKYDEWEYAKSVIEQTGAKAHKVYPSFHHLQKDLEKLLWHMDEPFGSTSQFSQWCVFQGATEAGLKVMLDGQGSDEQLAGYSGNDLPLYSGLLKNMRLAAIISETNAFRKMQGHFPKSQLIGAARRTWPFLDHVLPASVKKAPANYIPSWINYGYKQIEGNLDTAKSLRDTLVQQTLITSLPVLLRYEDRNSMAWSIESRVPFMDYRFVEFCLSLPEHLVYIKGIRKYILREAMKGVFPNKIYERRDKMGFVTPEETWIKGEGKDWFKNAIDNTTKELPEIIGDRAKNEIDLLLSGKNLFNFSYWRLACLGSWLCQQKRVSEIKTT